MSADSPESEGTKPPLPELLKERHREACVQGLDAYIDPESGYTVFTREYHLRRGTCCQSGCRHCPYGRSPYAE